MRVKYDPCNTNNEFLSQLQMEQMTYTYLSMSLGGDGWEVINDTAVHVRDYYKLVSLDNATKIRNITFYPSYSGNWNGAVSAITIPQRETIYGDISSVQLTAGAFIGYWMK